MISNCSFDDNVASSNDGGVARLEGSLSSQFDRCNFSSNSAQYGGAFEMITSNVKVNDCHFQHNSAIYGGVAHTDVQSEVRFNNTVFNHNLALYDGGMMDMYNGSIAFINDCMFINNSAQHGGVVRMETSSISIQHSEFYYNKATIHGAALAAYSKDNVSIHDSKFVHNKALQDVGVAYFFNGTISDIKSCQFTSNNADYGGALVAIRRSIVDITNCTFDSNTARTDGATLYGYTLCTFYVDKCTFVNNVAQNDGALRVTQNSVIIISESGFLNNRAFHDGGMINVYDNTSLTINSCHITNSRAGGSAGAVYGRLDSKISIRNSTINNCSAQNLGGGVRVQRSTHVEVSACNFTANTADNGGSMHVSIDSRANVVDSNFLENTANLDGGVFVTSQNSNLHIYSSTFNLSAANSGGVISAYKSTLVIVNSSFSNNTGEFAGVARLLEECEVFATGSNFTYNKADHGGVFYGDTCGISIEFGFFVRNTAALSGGVVYLDNEGFLNFTDNHFIQNTAEIMDGGVMSLHNKTATHITSCSFECNEAKNSNGGVASLEHSSITIKNASFNLSLAGNSGGAIYASSTRISITNNQFTNSKASLYGGVLSLQLYSSLLVSNSTFTNNMVDRYGGAISVTEGSTGNLLDSTFVHNRATQSVGGALSLYRDSSINIIECFFSHNEAAKSGAAIAVEESSISFLSDTLSEFQNQASDTEDTQIVSNIAQSGGGIYLIKSRLQLTSQVNITGNEARIYGGGIHAIDSHISIGDVVFIDDNSALSGGGMSLMNSNISEITSEGVAPSIHFMSNQANFGGALYVDNANDDTSCTGEQECFFEGVKMTAFFNFDGNQANSHNGGDDLFGGLLDRCLVDVNHEPGDGITRFMEISNIDASNSTISSLPVKLCICVDDQPNCTLEAYSSISVTEGDPFNVSVVAVDQAGNPLMATVRSSAKDLTLPADQTIDNIDATCSNLEYQVLFPTTSRSNHVLTLYADNGPCMNRGFSRLNVNVEILNCYCGPGFMKQQNTIACNCTCDDDKEFSKYITACDSKTRTVTREGLFWITYLHKDNNSSHYLIYPYCPVDYCLPSTSKVQINLNLPNGSDAQCANNRAGVLCGTCRSNYSLSLGSSSCVKCPEDWYITRLLVIIIGAVLCGILLVILSLALNLTVTLGTLNSVVFYANIIYAKRSVYFRHPQSIVASWFISWLNLDIGFDTCFFTEMDGYHKVWIQLAFPLYMILLVIVITVASSCSSRFARLIGKRDPVATLATLILVSYARLLDMFITSLQFVSLKYPNGTYTLLWLPETSIGFGNLTDTIKLIAVIILAFIILVLTLLFTFIIFSWQWLIRCSHLKLFKWTRNQKLNSAIATYNAPYTAKHRYWTGLRLIVRIVVYGIAAGASSSEQPITLLSTLIIVLCLLFYKTILGIRVYKKWLVNAIESAMYFNIIILALISLYTFSVQGDQYSLEILQVTTVYLSVGATFLLLSTTVALQVYNYGCRRLHPCLRLNSKLNELVSNPTPSEHDRPVNRDNIQTSDNAVLDAIDDRRIRYNTPFVKIPTTTYMSMTESQRSLKGTKDT